MKRFLKILLLSLPVLFPAISLAEIQTEMVEPAGVEFKHITHRKIDSTGGLQAPYSSKDLRTFIGPDLNRCGGQGTSEDKAFDVNLNDDTICNKIQQQILSNIADCADGYSDQDYDGDCEPDPPTCKTGEADTDGDGDCEVLCPPGQTSNGSGGCKSLYTQCPDGYYDPQSDGSCELEPVVVTCTGNKIPDGYGNCVCPGNQIDEGYYCQCPYYYSGYTYYYYMDNDGDGWCETYCTDDPYGGYYNCY